MGKGKKINFNRRQLFFSLFPSDSLNPQQVAQSVFRGIFLPEILSCFFSSVVGMLDEHREFCDR